MRIRIVDDDTSLRQSLAMLLTGASYDVETAAEPAHGLERALAERFDLILCDVRMPAMDGLTFLRRYRAEGGSAILLMMSAFGGEDAAIEAMREGAYDYLTKPFRPDEVLLTVRKAAEREGLLREVETLRATIGAEPVRSEVVAESKSMRNVLELASRVAAHATTVLITGESGTGKEVLARAIHRMSPRRDEVFTAVNCAAIPESLLESELFGHMKGSFTGATQDRVGLFEASHGGTLLLDEIGDMPQGLQAKLLRVLEEGEIRRLGSRDSRPVDVRLIAATAQPLDTMVARGEFREDLYYRLNVVQLRIPALRERPEDIAALVTHYVRQAAERMGHSISITPGALVALTEHAWPGNVRELRNAVERAAVLSAGGRLDLDAFQLHDAASGNGSHNGNGHAHANGNGNGNGSGNGNGAAHLNGTYQLKPQVEQLERIGIRRALDAAGGNRRDAARLLGVSLRTLFYKLRRYQLE
jgi:two-component system response regulator AtoC